MSVSKEFNTMESERVTPPRPFRRARSDERKRERHRDILAAARDHLADVGIDGFSMGALAASVGVARGTLYLYFLTREEVLLALYLEETSAWVDEFGQLIEPEMDADEFLQVVYTSATRRDILIELAPRVTGVIENNVSIERLIESKRHAARITDVAGQLTGLALGRTVDQGTTIARALFALLLGVTGSMRTPHIGDVAALPPDVQQLLGAEHDQEAFVRIGRWLIEGSRLDDTPRG
jgi:AcrR family transcriptional regulator